ncbi:MAG: cupredoxin family copper-binding protein [Parcubacteria group bacterium]|jgi:plastocyanin
MKKIAVITLVVAGAIVLGGCSLYGGTSSNTATSTPAPTQGTNMVNIQNFAFNLGTLTIKKGETVTWTNNDSVLHQIKSATFNSSQLSKGQTFSFTFDDAGTFDYSCAIHPSMMGKIIVE